MKIDERTYVIYQKFVENHSEILVEPVEEGYSSGKLFKATIEDRLEGAVVIPIIPNYPQNLVEVIAPNNLKELLGLKNGDEIVVEISDQ